MFKIKITGNLFDKRAIEIEVEENVKAAAHSALADLREETPVLTGNARDSWSIQYVPGSAVLYNSEDYVKYLNAGSSQQAPRFYIERIAMKYGKIKDSAVTYE